MKDKRELLVIIQEVSEKAISFYFLGSQDTVATEFPRSDIEEIVYDHFTSKTQAGKEALLKHGALRAKFKSPYNIIYANKNYLYHEKVYKKLSKLEELPMNEYQLKMFKKAKGKRKTINILYATTAATLIGVGIHGGTLVGDCFFDPDCEISDARGTNAFIYITALEIGMILNLEKQNREDINKFIDAFNSNAQEKPNNINMEKKKEGDKTKMKISLGITNNGLGLVINI